MHFLWSKLLVYEKKRIQTDKCVHFYNLIWPPKNCSKWEHRVSNRFKLKNICWANDPSLITLPTDPSFFGPKLFWTGKRKKILAREQSFGLYGSIGQFRSEKSILASSSKSILDRVNSENLLLVHRRTEKSNTLIKLW